MHAASLRPRRVSGLLERRVLGIEIDAHENLSAGRKGRTFFRLGRGTLPQGTLPPGPKTIPWRVSINGYGYCPHVLTARRQFVLHSTAPDVSTPF